MTDTTPATGPLRAVDIIATKRDGGELTTAQIAWMIDRYVAGDVADEQMSALLMAIYLNGLTSTELRALTSTMLHSGERLDFTDLGKPTADKHSTGGVGDKITLPLTPLVASYGVAVPQLSGRGLGHTGGTLDKLEAIPGFRVNLTESEIRKQLSTVGGVICAPTATLAPADRKLYALRDATSTVESIPLIASSIMSKKLAEGTSSLVLDVKTGAGAFMTEREAATELARTMVEIGTEFGVTTTALLTDMNAPIGFTAGNGLEVEESLDVLAGGGPADVVELTVALAAEMLRAAGVDVDDPAENLRNGQAMDTWRALVCAQDGDPGAKLPVARESQTLTLADLPAATRDGAESLTVTGIDARIVGDAARWLGAGRARKEDAVQAAAGVRLHVSVGDKLTASSPSQCTLATVYTDTPEAIDDALAVLASAFTVGDGAPEGQRSRILHVIRAE